MVKSSYLFGLLAISLIFFVIATNEIQMAEGKHHGWVYKSGCFDSCSYKCKHFWGGYYGSCKWHHGHYGCYCYYGH